MRGAKIACGMLLVAATVLPVQAVEGRIPIWETGTVLTQPGSYVLTRDIPTNTTGPAITIAARRVTLDLNGFTVDNSNNVTDPAIQVTSTKADVVIRNGLVKSGATGILATGSLPGDPDNSLRIEDLQLENSDVCIDVVAISTVRIERNSLRGCVVGIRVGCGGCGRGVQGAIDENLVLQSDNALEISDAHGLSIENNRILNQNTANDAIDLANSASVKVHGNNLGHGGIRLTNTTGSSFVENTIEGQWPANTVGIVDDAASRSNRYVSNTIEFVSGHGIQLFGDRNLLVGNQINHCGGFGIAFEAGSDENYYRGNQAFGNGGGACTAPAGNDACFDGTGNLSGGDNAIAGVLQ